MSSTKAWHKNAKEWRCLECGAVNSIDSDVCKGCDCSLEGFVDDAWLYENLEED